MDTKDEIMLQNTKAESEALHTGNLDLHIAMPDGKGGWIKHQPLIGFQKHTHKGGVEGAEITSMATKGDGKMRCTKCGKVVSDDWAGSTAKADEHYEKCKK